jgi:signal transduction histidine kinase
MNKHGSLPTQVQPSIEYVLARPTARVQLMPSERILRIVLVSLVVALYVLALSMSALTVIKGDHDWGIQARPTGARTGVWQITWVDRGLAADYDIVVGDQVIQVNGHFPRSNQEINQANHLAIHTLTGAVRSLQWAAPSLVISIIWSILGLLCLVPGVLVFLHATERSLAYRFLVLWSALAIASALAVAETYGNLFLTHIENVLFSGIAVGMGTNVIWLLLFPPRVVGQLQQRHRWLPEIPLFTALLISMTFFVALQLHNASLLMIYVIAVSLQAIVCLGFALVSVLVLSCSRRASLARERARVLLGGVLLGFVPLLALDILPTTFGGVPLIPGQFSVLSIGVLPFTFAYALVKHDLVHLDALVRRTAHLILSIFGAVTLAILLAQGLVLLPSTLALLFALGAGGMLLPLIHIGARWLTEAWLFPQVKRYRRILEQVPTQAGATDPYLLAQQLIARVRLAQLPVAAVAVFVRNPSGEYTTLAPLAEDEAPEACLTSTIEMDHDLFLWLNRRGKPALVQPLPVPNDPDPPHALRSAPPLPDPCHQQRSSVPPWALLVPIRVYDHTGALLALSEREDAQPFAPSDMSVCSSIASQYAVPLEFALSHDALQAVQETKERLEEWKDALMTSASSALLTPLSLLQRQLADLTRFAPEQIRKQPTLVAQEVLRLWQEARQLDQTAKHWQEELELHQDQELQLQNVEVSAVIGQVVEAMLARAAEKRIFLRNLIPKPTPRWVVLADPTALYRVLQRLLNNAIKASPPEGRIHLLAKEVYRSDQPSLVQIIVQDAGGPLARDTQYLLFERYAQVDGERDNLANARQVIQAMHGDMGIDNDERRTLVSCWVNLQLAALDLPTSSAGTTPGTAHNTSAAINGKESILSSGERGNQILSDVITPAGSANEAGPL